MRYKPLIVITMFFLLASAWAGAEEPCRSLSGGHCINLAPLEVRSAVGGTAAAQGGLLLTGLAAVVPGLEFLGETPGDTGGLIARLYVFGLSLVGVSALIMLTFGGVIYMTAGDSQSRVNQAKSMMGNAVFGLVLALISFLILFTINPDLVTKGFPTPKAISPSPVQPGGNAAGCDDPDDPKCPNSTKPPVTPTTPPNTTEQTAPGG